MKVLKSELMVRAVEEVLKEVPFMKTYFNLKETEVVFKPKDKRFTSPTYAIVRSISGEKEYPEVSDLISISIYYRSIYDELTNYFDRDKIPYNTYKMFVRGIILQQVIFMSYMKNDPKNYWENIRFYNESENQQSLNPFIYDSFEKALRYANSIHNEDLVRVIEISREIYISESHDNKMSSVNKIKNTLNKKRLLFIGRN